MFYKHKFEINEANKSMRNWNTYLAKERMVMLVIRRFVLKMSRYVYVLTRMVFITAMVILSHTDVTSGFLWELHDVISLRICSASLNFCLQQYHLKLSGNKLKKIIIESVLQWRGFPKSLRKKNNIKIKRDVLKEKWSSYPNL